MKVANAVMAVLFVIGAVVQYNDPDPLGWIAMYLSAAAACALAGRVDRGWIAPTAVGAVALAWGAVTASAIERFVNPMELVGPMGADNSQIELMREALGLLIIAVWMLALVLVERARARTR